MVENKEKDAQSTGGELAQRDSHHGTRDQQKDNTMVQTQLTSLEQSIVKDDAANSSQEKDAQSTGGELAQRDSHEETRDQQKDDTRVETQHTSLVKDDAANSSQEKDAQSTGELAQRDSHEETRDQQKDDTMVQTQPTSLSQ